jgi:hypothetical protein
VRHLAFVLAVTAFGAAAAAAGIDSRVYRCAELQALIAARGFVFISQPAFGDFVVAGPYFCGSGDIMRPRSVPTADNPECLVNYCVPPPEHVN